jgi:hypothetical protein
MLLTTGIAYDEPTSKEQNMKRTINTLTDRQGRPSFIGQKLGRVARYTALAILLVVAAIGARSGAAPATAHTRHTNTPVAPVPAFCAVDGHFEFISNGPASRVPTSPCAGGEMRAV